REQLAVNFDGNAILDGFDRQLVAVSLRFDDGGDLHFLNELGEQNGLASLHGRFEAHLRQRAIDEIGQTLEASLEERSCAAVGSDGPAFENIESQHRGTQPVAELVREKAEALRLSVGVRLIAHSSI